MRVNDIFTTEAIALNYTNAASNDVAYLGAGFFPGDKKAGLDLKWLRGAKGLPVSLAPSVFDAKAKFRDRVGISINETEMPFFREGYIIKEKDRQEIMRVQDTTDPYAKQVIDGIFNDTKELIDGANVVPERMIMQLLAPVDGNFGINVSAKGVNYTYNYDPDGTLKAKHYMKLVSEADKWTSADTCDPMDDLETALDAQEAVSGNRPKIALMTKSTLKLMKNSKRVQSGVLAQNTTANVNYTIKKVKAFIEEELDITIITYDKMFTDEEGQEKKFYTDNMVALLPDGPIGKTWYGTTPEEADGNDSGADVSIVNTGVAISTYTTPHPVNTHITASEIVLPSWEKAEQCYFIEVA